LCDAPRRPAQPIYGSNDWYFRYGQNSHASVLQDAAITAELASNPANPPYAVIDAGWQVGRRHEHDLDSGDRTRGNSRFPDMPGLAQAIKGLDVRPGIWVRPLIAADGIRRPAGCCRRPNRPFIRTCRCWIPACPRTWTRWRRISAAYARGATS
jgi:alpha-galactosidase